MFNKVYGVILIRSQNIAIGKIINQRRSILYPKNNNVVGND